MSAAPAQLPARPVPAAARLGRAVAAEWTRLWTVRSTLWSLLAAFGLAVAMGTIFGNDTSEDLPIWAAGEFTIVPAQLPLLMMVALSVTGDYATGAIRTSLQWVPRRGALLAARTAVAVAVATAAGVGVALVADTTAWLWLRTEFSAADIAASLGDVAVVVGGGALVTAALATILRSTAGTVTSAFLLLLALTLMLSEVGFPWLAAIGRHVPGIALALLEALGGPGEPARHYGVLAAWVVGTTAAGVWLFHRRDAS